ELEKAQQQDATIPHTWFNLGIAYKRKSLYNKAIVQLEGFLGLVPVEPVAHYNLGVLYKLEKKNELAVSHFEDAARLDQNLAGPHFQLATAYRQAKKMTESKLAMATFRRIKAEQAGSMVPEDLEWSFYSEIYETIDPQNAQTTAPPIPFNFAIRSLASGILGQTVLDVNGDGVPDVLAWSEEWVHLFTSGNTKKECGLESLKDVSYIEAGDFDNDGTVDLCVGIGAGVALYRNVDGIFEAYDSALPQRVFNSAVWLDYDHDYDVDLFLLGKASVLFRNNGKAGFSDLTSTFPFVEGEASSGVQFDLVADTQGMDLAVTYVERSGVLYRDLLAGKYQAQDLTTLMVTQLTAFDFNHDGWTDLAGTQKNGVTLLVNDQKGGLVPVDAPKNTKGPLLFADIANRAVSEMVVGNTVFYNRGLSVFESVEMFDDISAVLEIASGDFNDDGKVDLSVIDEKGGLTILDNVTVSQNWLKVGLEGVKNLVLAPAAEVEVKVGIRYQKKTYRGRPLLFGLGDASQAEAVRITWPNGLIQNETKQATGQVAMYKEAQRLSGSCPMIFTWNGSEFEFITDVLGVAPLGASAGDGTYFPVDNDEYVQIAGESLVAKDGKYQIRITEELREIAYLDAISLIAVAHPVGTDIFTNDKFKGAPFPEFRLFGVHERKYPISAVDHDGRDVLTRLTQQDQVYPDAFLRDHAGAAELHHLDLDFGDVAADGQAVLILSGWVDWADGSTFLGVSQEDPDGLVFPYLQVKNDDGEWQTVIEDMGLPAGKPKIISVDLSGKFLTRSREVRIVTSLCVYWDEIFIGEDPNQPQTELVHLTPQSARLKFRGFSEVVIHPERKQPEYFIYGQKRPMKAWNWNPTPGMYTRFGDVQMPLTKADDLMVVMGSGDEIELAFDAAGLPDLPDGWRRDFLLMVDGWAKDGDANTAFSQTVLPLPYHAMPQYPYELPHAFPRDGIHQRYYEAYQTRPALQFIRPLNEGMRSVSVGVGSQ
ncbi:MAG: hypothetical protein HN521_13590, partial [Candidatus Latescibacteria bacterium]|nr:hypothetical protein [Candidatus Latescibacterota bacterium]